MENSNHKILYFPIKLMLTFLVVTELLLWLGPRDFHIDNSFALFLYLVVVNIALWLGYKVGITKYRNTVRKRHIIRVELVISIGFVLTVIGMLSTFSHRGVSFSNIFNYLIFALSNPGEAYYAEEEAFNTNYLLLLLTPISSAAIPLGIYYWKRINMILKFLVILIAIVTIMRWLGTGTRKGVFDIMIIIFTMIIASNPNYISVKNERKKLLFPIFIIVLLFIFYFVFSNLSRYGLSSINDYQVSASSFRPFYTRIFPLPVVVSINEVTGYLCQGYRALAESISMGIIPPAPMGSSWFLIALAKKLGYDPTNGTYMSILEKTTDIDMSVNWHTIYVWLANDVTLIGVPVVVFLIGLIFALAWKDVVYKTNYTAVPLLSLLFLMIFYFYANNQVLSFEFVPFVFWLGYYLYTRYIYQYSVKNGVEC